MKRSTPRVETRGILLCPEDRRLVLEHPQATEQAGDGQHNQRHVNHRQRHRGSRARHALFHRQCDVQNPGLLGQTLVPRRAGKKSSPLASIERRRHNKRCDVFRCSMYSVRPRCHLEQMIAELCLHRSLNGADVRGEHNLIELRNHVASTELAEITAGLSGRTR